MTKTTAASNGSKTSEPDKPDHGLIVLRDKEARGLISLACDALSQTHEVVHDLHRALFGYGDAADGDSRHRLQMLNEAVSCLSTTEHYLLMLSSVVEEQDNAARGPDTCPDDRPF